MADGNVGSLFMTLGIKDEISAALKNIGNKLKGTNEAAEKVNASLQKQVETANKGNFGEVFNKAIAHIQAYNKDLLNTNKILLAMQGVKFDAKDMFGDLTKISSYLTTLDAEIRKIENKKANLKDKETLPKEDQTFLDKWKERINNALQYIRILQDIQSEQNKIDKKVGLNPNVDTATATKAKKMFSEIREQVMTVFQNGGIDDAKVMSSYGKLLTMARKASSDMMDAFGKQNPLSSYENWTARLEAEFDRLRAKAFDLRRAIELDGDKHDTKELEARVRRLGELGNMVTKALSSPEILSNSVRVRNLVSDISVEMVRATATSNIYNNERRITEAIERQYAREVAATNKEHEKNLQAIDREAMALQKNAEIQQRYTDAIDRARKKEELAQERADASEYKRKKRQTEQLLKDIDREGIAMQKNAEIQQRYSDAIDKAISKKLEAQSKYQGKRDEEQLRFENAVNAAIGERILLRQKEAEEQRRLLSMVAPTNEITKRFTSFMQQEGQIRPSHPLFNADSARDLQIAYGKAFDNLAKQWDELVAKMKTISPNLDGNNLSGKPLSSRDLAVYNGLKSELDVIETKMQGLVTLSERLASRTSAMQSATYKPYSVNSQEEAQKRMQESNALKNAIIERMQAEKQRQREIEVTTRRIESLQRALDNLKEKKFTSDSFGLNTQQAAAQINLLSADMQKLLDIKTRLENGDRTAIGIVGDTGNGRVVSGANYIAAQYEKANRQAEKNLGTQDKLAQKIREAGRQAQEQLVKGFKDAHNAASGLNSTVQDLKSLFLQGGLVFGAQQFAMSIIRTGGEMEKQHIAMQSILGDMQNANTMFNQTKELALQSPFTFSELNRDVKQLAAYGVEYENLYDTTKRLADMASGLGVSFERIALAFGQVQARGWLDGKELRQIAYAGIPLLDRLSKYYSMREGKKVSTSDVKGRITNREVSFQDVKNIFWEMTDAGGQFYNMQLTLSETLLGRYNKLKDAWEIMLADFARGDSVIGGTFKWVLDLVTSLVQQMHTLGPVMTAAFAGFAIKKGITAFGGGGAANFLSNKANLANNIQAQLTQGKQISQIEQQILLTKNKITNADLRSLIAYQNITKQELRRLYLSGAITNQQYKTSLALMKQVALTNAAAASTNNYALSWRKVGVAGMLALNGIGNAIKGLWAAIGGLPGLIVTAVTMGITTIASKYQDLTQKIKQTQDEILDRRKQVAEFMSQNNVAKAVASGDIKEIDNLIESYKGKLKELASYDYSNLLMKAEEKKNHEERLKYLEQELKLIDKANNANANRFADTGAWYTDMLGITGGGRRNYEIIMNSVENANNAAVRYSLAFAKANAYGATSEDKEKFKSFKSGFVNYANNLKEDIVKVFGDISKDENLRRQAVQAMNNIFSTMGVSAENANLIRTSVLQAFGISNDGWLSGEVGKRMSDLISERFPEIALKIKTDQSLNRGEKQKVAQLMNDAKTELISQYPIFSTTLQNLLDASNFKAVIHLTTQEMGGAYNDAQKEMARRIPAMVQGNDETLLYYQRQIDSWGEEGDWYSARNKAKSDIDLARNKYKSAVESKTKDVGKYKKEYQDLKNAALQLLNYDYEGELKKSNKTSGDKEDSELKALRERIDAFKAFRQMYQKAKDVMPKDKAKDWAYGLFPEMKDLNPEDYIGSIEKLKKGFNFKLSDERKKALTSLNREIGDWKISEILKPEFEKAAANFKEALDKTMKQWDLWRTLMDKTGKEDFANLAFTNGGIFDEQANNLVRQFEVDYGMKFPGIYANDGDAKEALKGTAGAYERWKAIADLVKNNYVKYLQEAADIIEKTASFEEKRAAVSAKYGSLISTAEKVGDSQTATRYRIQRDKELGNVNLEEFKQSSRYLNFFGAVLTMTAEQAQDTANQIKETLLKALGEGSMDAREYAKQIDQVNEQLKAVSKGKKTFWNSGMQGVREQKLQDAYAEQTVASNTFNEAFRKYNEAMIEGNAEGMKSAKIQMDAAKKQLKAADEKVKEENKKSALSESFVETVKKINTNIESLVSTFNDVKETADLLGVDTTTNAWQDVSAAFESIQGVSNGISTAVTSYQSGNYMGVVQGVVSVFTSPIKAFAKAHDAKLDRRIQQAERNIRAIDNMSNNISTLLEKILGGLYSYTNNADTVKALKDIMQNNEKGSEAYNAAQKALNSGNYFDTQYAALLAQKSEIQKQRDAEDRKKKTDQDALADYDQQLKELDMQIKSYAQDFLKEMYDIDIKNWASQLTDAIVEAWAKGEDAVDAYRDKVQEMMKSLTKNILSQKIMEIALQPVLGSLEDMLKKNGRLDETDIATITKDLLNAEDNAVANITGILDELKKQGLDLSQNGSSSVSNSIKGITESTADLLASYLNACRADLSVVRNLHERYYPQFSEIGNAQIIQMKSIAQNTLRNAEAAERIEVAVNSLDGNMKAVINGTKRLYIK